MSLEKHLLFLRLKSASGLPPVKGPGDASFCEMTFRGKVIGSDLDNDECVDTPEWNETFTWQLEDAPKPEEKVYITVRQEKERKRRRTLCGTGNDPVLAKAEIRLDFLLKEETTMPVFKQLDDVALFDSQNHSLGIHAKLRVDVSYVRPLSSIIQSHCTQLTETLNSNMTVVLHGSSGCSSPSTEDPNDNGFMEALKEKVQDLKDKNEELRTEISEAEKQLEDAQAKIEGVKEQLTKTSGRQVEVSDAVEELQDLINNPPPSPPPRNRD